MREQGRLNQLAQSLVMRGWSEVHLGHWDIAASDAQEAATLAKETAQAIWEAGAHVAQAFLAAVRGDEEAALSLAAAADEIVLPARGRAVIAVVQLTRGVAALGAGRNEEAFEHLRRMLDPSELSHHRMTNHWALVGLCEAAVQIGRADEARTALHDLERNAAYMPSPLFHQALRHARALLAPDSDAEKSYSDALALNENAPPFERARLQLAYGIWLRRQRRASDARAPLRAARDAFDALGAIPWGVRARRELRASGESSRRRSPDARDELTPQELQIAQMAADGLSNREIGQKLYLSHRTIGFHLYRVFPKLGIKSRAELGRALSATADA
jgi:ATP/maltotriose-dependent transcriptional regulator MalT